MSSVAKYTTQNELLLNNLMDFYTDTSTADIGNTAAVDFTTSVVGGNLVLTANIASGTWEIKTAYRAL